MNHPNKAGTHAPLPSDAGARPPAKRRLRTSRSFLEQIDDLLKETAQGDTTAFSALYDKLAPAIWLAALSACQDQGSACAATEEVFVQVWRTAPSLAVRSDCPVSGLLEVANRVLRRHARNPAL